MPNMITVEPIGYLPVQGDREKILESIKMIGGDLMLPVWEGKQLTEKVCCVSCGSCFHLEDLISKRLSTSGPCPVCKVTV